jgi:hypothetical protein
MEKWKHEWTWYKNMKNKMNCELMHTYDTPAWTYILYMPIFSRIFLSNYWWQKSDIWSQASYKYAILWEGFLDLSDFYFLFADLVAFYTHWTYILYMPIFSHIFLSNYWWQKSDIWSQASYRYPLPWEAYFDPSDSYFLIAEERGYHKWALAHSWSCSCLYAPRSCCLNTNKSIYQL